MAKTILYINDFNIAGGAESVFRDTAELMKKRYQVEKFFGTENYSTADSFLDYIYSGKNYRLLQKKLSECSPDIIHIHGYYHILSPSILMSIRHYKKNHPDTRVIYTAHDSHLLCPNSILIRYRRFTNKPQVLLQKPNLHQLLCYKWDHRSILHSAMKKLQWFLAYKILGLQHVFDVIVSPSQRVADMLSDITAKVRTSVLRNPMGELEKLKKQSTVSAVNTKDKIRLLFVGRISKEKNLTEFLDILLQAQVKNIHLDIIGDGPDQAALVQQIKSTKNQMEVELWGRRDHAEVMKIMPQYHALVLCSLNETAPLTIVEAALNGLRILTLPRFGMKEMGDICGAVYYFEMNAESLRTALESMRQDIEKGRMPDRDLEKIISTFSIETYEKSLRDLYEQGIIKNNSNMN